MRPYVFIGSGFWAVLYSIYIYLVFRGYYTPEFKSDIAAGIITTTRVVGVTALFAIIHVAFQSALLKFRPATMAIGDKVFDVATSLMPIVALLFSWFFAMDTTGRVIWWPVLSFWLALIVGASVIADLINMWQGFVVWTHDSPAAPANHHPAPPHH